MVWLDTAQAQELIASAGRVEIAADPRDGWEAFPLGTDGVLVVGDNVRLEEPVVLEEKVVFVATAHKLACANTECTSLLAAAFDRTGARIWDTSAPMPNVTPFGGPAGVQLHADHLTMAFSTGHRFYVLSAERGHSRRLVARDLAIGASEGWGARPTEWWYDDWFLLSGFEARHGDTLFALTKVAAQ